MKLMKNIETAFYSGAERSFSIPKIFSTNLHVNLERRLWNFLNFKMI
jgi:hypothetical protein